VTEEFFQRFSEILRTADNSVSPDVAQDTRGKKLFESGNLLAQG
jgi:hypothetical protein